MSLIGSHAQVLERRGLQQATIARREDARDRAQPLARMLFDGLRYVEGDVALGLAQADEQK